MSPSAYLTGHHVISELLALLEETDLAQAMSQADELHRIRVAIKKVRAWLRLYRDVSGDSSDYRQLVVNLREISRTLASQRDREVACQTLAKLARKYPGKKTRYLVEEVSLSLQEQSSTASAAPDQIDELRQELLPTLQWTIPAESGRAAIIQTYTKMCQCGKVALKAKQCEALHAWRKQVKTLGYQLTIADCHHGRQAKLYEKITKLGNKLGKVHDLCFLREMLLSQVATGSAIGDMNPLYKRIEREKGSQLRVIRKHYAYICRDVEAIF